MSEQDKVTVDDIIDIVKTEEQTNSVEEVRKLRGRGNETAKRFKFICDDEKCFFKDRNKALYCYEVVDLLNSLSNENEQLKTIIQQLRTDNTKQKKLLNTTMKENEQLKCGNKNLKATLNDFINICNRLQSNPTDKQTLGVARDMLQNMGVDLE